MEAVNKENTTNENEASTTAAAVQERNLGERSHATVSIVDMLGLRLQGLHSKFPECYRDNNNKDEVSMLIIITVHPRKFAEKSNLN